METFMVKCYFITINSCDTGRLFTHEKTLAGEEILPVSDHVISSEPQEYAFHKSVL